MAGKKKKQVLLRMKSNIIFLLATMTFIVAGHSQNTVSKPSEGRPKLVVGLVIDQMRWDFLYRYAAKYGANGFNRLLRQGYACENTQIPYVPTYTAPGHSCIYTGSVPGINGIIGNNWFNRNSGTTIYCTDDNSYQTVGDTTAAGKMSPHQLLTTTICDELKLATNFKAKTVGIAIKDRSSILPAGHTADAAYWFSGESGNWISSTYYCTALPKWVQKSNLNLAKNAKMNETWKTLLSLDRYQESTIDDASWESPFKNEKAPVFIHDVKELLDKNSEILKSLPYGNKMTLDFAKDAVIGEDLGKDAITDFLAVSLSTPDYIGHQFGPNSVEVEDNYLRLDKELESFLQFLDGKVGKNNYVLFLTADHGAAHNSAFLQNKKVPAGNMTSDSLKQKIRNYLTTQFQDSTLFLRLINQQVYLNRAAFGDQMDKLATVKLKLINYIKTIPGVMNVVDLEQLQSTTLVDELRTLIENGYNPQRSGDLYIVFNPAWMDDHQKGTTHGTSFRYDTHIPLIWYGWNIKKGKDYSPVRMSDIAPTLASLLRIQEPNGCVGQPILGVLKR